ncbi:hypothetical protein VNO77_02896 [Canavalia gladiata]|uniref:Uncharacterized protein n=1 Tax=Canavalia gladiata TaxID=3824 RepID=A0AAN9MZE4_CANGL
MAIRLVCTHPKHSKPIQVHTLSNSSGSRSEGFDIQYVQMRGLNYVGNLKPLYPGRFKESRVMLASYHREKMEDVAREPRAFVFSQDGDLPTKMPITPEAEQPPTRLQKCLGSPLLVRRLISIYHLTAMISYVGLTSVEPNMPRSPSRVC